MYKQGLSFRQNTHFVKMCADVVFVFFICRLEGVGQASLKCYSITSVD